MRYPLFQSAPRERGESITSGQAERRNRVSIRAPRAGRKWEAIVKTFIRFAFQSAPRERGES